MGFLLPLLVFSLPLITHAQNETKSTISASFFDNLSINNARSPELSATSIDMSFSIIPFAKIFDAGFQLSGTWSNMPYHLHKTSYALSYGIVSVAPFIGLESSLWMSPDNPRRKITARGQFGLGYAYLFGKNNVDDNKHKELLKQDGLHGFTLRFGAELRYYFPSSFYFGVGVSSESYNLGGNINGLLPLKGNRTVISRFAPTILFGLRF